MAVGGHPAARLQDDATCSICLDYFQDPVVIDCGHNYCRACISQCQGEGSRCPRCRIPFLSDNLRPNRDLRNLVEAIQQLSLQPFEKATQPNLCEKHQEAVKLFCQEDKAFLCLVCRESRAHKAHTALPIEEAAQEYRDQIQTFLKKLTKERDEMQKAGLPDEKSLQRLKSAVESAKQRIEFSYPNLVQTLVALLNTCEQMIEAAKDLSCLNKLISEIDEKSQQSSFGFLQGVGDLLNRCEQETQRPRHDLKALMGSITEQCMLLDTRLNQHAENTSKKKWIKENITLDAKTAHPRYVVSDDRKSVHWVKSRQDLPYSPKRFDFARCVLGKKGFTSGKHYWVVDVNDGYYWAVGVAKASVDRKGKLDFKPDEGIWAMARYDDQYKALTSPPTLLDLDYDPKEIQVSLNYDAGIVHFYDEDKKPLYSFRSIDFEGEKVFPFFRIGDSSTSLYLL